MSFDPSDTAILRDLAKEYAELAAGDVNRGRRELWYRHNDMASERPIVLVESGDVAHEFMNESDLKCTDGWARAIERSLRIRMYHFRNVCDDTVLDDGFRMNWSVATSDYGVKVDTRHGIDSGGHSVGYRWEPPLGNLDSDFEKLHPRTYSADPGATLRTIEGLRETIGDIIPVGIGGSFWWTMGLTQQAIFLRGLDNFMMDMYDNPEGVHRLMAFLRDDHMAYARWLESEGLLTLNNGNDYIGSGSYGFTRSLPQPDHKEGDRVRLKDMWVLLESQETVGISPTMFEEFIAPYQRGIAEDFGLVYYGCCEPVHNRWKSLEKIPNLHSVSVSPWCDEEYMAGALAGRFVYSRKPSPTLISTGVFDEDAMRADLERTLRLTKAAGCTVELIMKDVHTLHGDASRMGRWVRLAREAIEAIW